MGDSVVMLPADERISEFIDWLGERGVSIRRQGANLCVRAPPGVVTAAIKAELVARKFQLLDFISQSGEGALNAEDPPGKGPSSIELTPEQALILRAAGGAAYVVSGVFRASPGPLPCVFESAVQHIVARHDALRLQLDHSIDPPLMRFLPEAGFTLEWLDLRCLDQSCVETVMRHIANADALRPFELTSEPALRVRAIALQDEIWEYVLSIHHLVMDRASLDVLAAELMNAFEAIEAGRPTVYSTVQASFAALATKRLKAIESGRYRADVEVTTQLMRGGAALVQLPGESAVPRDLSAAGRVVVDIPPAARALLRCRRQPVAEIMGALFALLRRYASGRPICIGFPISLRDDMDTDRVVGMLTNTVPLCCTPIGEQSFEELVKQVADSIGVAVDRRGTPMTEVLARLPPEDRGSGLSPFRVLASVQRGVETGPNARIRAEEPGHSAAKCDLLVFLEEARLVFEYATPGLTRESMKRFAQDCVDILSKGLCSRHETLDEIDPPPFIPGAVVAIEPEATLVTLVEAQVANKADVIAVADYSGAAPKGLSYATLWQRSGAIAKVLRTHGVGPEVCVGIRASHGIERTLAVLAVLRAGGAYVPVDPRWPPTRCQFVLENSSARLLLTDVNGEAPISGLHAISIRDASKGEASVALQRPRPCDLAYVLYTSGSTGEPKGVAIEHHSAAAFIEWSRTAYTSGELHRVIAATPLHFDLSIFELFAPLACGGEVATADIGLDLPQVVRRAVPTLVNTVPSIADEALRAGLNLDSVETVNLAGEPPGRKLVQCLVELGVRRIENLYGPSETTTYSTSGEIRTSTIDSSIVGHAIANTRVYLEDLDHAPNKQLWMGEAIIAGAGVARGYLGRPRLTADAFRPDSYGPPGARAFKSGDRMCWRAPHGLKFLGRNDRQVKRRGQRIELDEIEAALHEVPGVLEAVAIAESNEHCTEIAAFVVLAEGCTRDEVSRGLTERLPTSLVPDSVHVFESLPKTVSGKLDRGRLRIPSVKAHSQHSPRSADEATVAAIWSEVLGYAVTDAEARFFEAGGDSLKLMGVLERLRSHFRVEISAVELLRGPTIRAMTELVATCRYRDRRTGRSGDK